MTILNKTKSSYNRYHILNGSMGNYGEPPTSPNHDFEIANGVDRGNGYQGYMSVTYALKKGSMPVEAQNKLRKILKEKGYHIQDINA